MLSFSEYVAIHQWISRHFKKTGICEICGSSGRKTEWSTKTGLHIRSRMAYQELCKPCHYRYDVEVLGRLTNKEIGRMGGVAKKRRPGGFAVMSPEEHRKASKKGGQTGKKHFQLLDKEELRVISSKASKKRWQYPPFVQ